MVKIIQLNRRNSLGSETPIYLVAEQITNFYWSIDYNETIINFNDDLVYVIETPEQIIELIKGAVEI